MTHDEIKTALINNCCKFGNVYVKINNGGGSGGRHIAYISTPSFNTICMTPETVNVEGILTFYERLTGFLLDIINEE